MMTVNDGSFVWAAERKQNFVGRRYHKWESRNSCSWMAAYARTRYLWHRNF